MTLPRSELRSPPPKGPRALGAARRARAVIPPKLASRASPQGTGGATRAKRASLGEVV